MHFDEHETVDTPNRNTSDAREQSAHDRNDSDQQLQGANNSQTTLSPQDFYETVTARQDVRAILKRLADS